MASSRTFSRRRLTCSIARSSWASDPGSCIPQSTSTTPGPAATAHALQCGMPGQGKGRGTFAGPGHFQGFAPNGARITIEGCDVLRVKDEEIVGNDAYLDTGAIAIQLGFLPPVGSSAQARLAGLANLATRLRTWVH